MADLGLTAPDFNLPTCNPEVDGLEGSMRSLSDFEGARALVVVFMCNHCPFVIHVQQELVNVAQDYKSRGVQLVGINSNDTVQYPADSFDNMRADARRLGYPFPYLFDESQQVALEFGAECTPDFFVYDDTRSLVYRGRLDSSRPGGDPADGSDLRSALDSLLAHEKIVGAQFPSVGCNIKWKPGIRR